MRAQELLRAGGTVLFDIYRNKNIYYLQTARITDDCIEFGNNIKPTLGFHDGKGYPLQEKFFESDYNDTAKLPWWLKPVVEQHHEAQYWVKATFHNQPKIRSDYLRLLREELDLWMFNHGFYANE